VNAPVDLEQLRALRVLRRAFGDVHVLAVAPGRVLPMRHPRVRRRQVPLPADPDQACLLNEEGGGARRDAD